MTDQQRRPASQQLPTWPVASSVSQPASSDGDARVEAASRSSICAEQRGARDGQRRQHRPPGDIAPGRSKPASESMPAWIGEGAGQARRRPAASRARTAATRGVELADAAVEPGGASVAPGSARSRPSRSRASDSRRRNERAGHGEIGQRRVARLTASCRPASAPTPGAAGLAPGAQHRAERPEIGCLAGRHEEHGVERPEPRVGRRRRERTGQRRARLRIVEAHAEPVRRRVAQQPAEPRLERRCGRRAAARAARPGAAGASGSSSSSSLCVMPIASRGVSAIRSGGKLVAPVVAALSVAVASGRLPWASENTLWATARSATASRSASRPASMVSSPPALSSAASPSSSAWVRAPAVQLLGRQVARTGSAAGQQQPVDDRVRCRRAAHRGQRGSPGSRRSSGRAGRRAGRARSGRPAAGRGPGRGARRR